MELEYVIFGNILESFNYYKLHSSSMVNKNWLKHMEKGGGVKVHIIVTI